MKLDPPPNLEDPGKEILALIETLQETQQRLEVLTEGEVDTVADRDGRTFMLRRAQEQLRHIEAAKQAAILNALPAHIALLDARGVIISVNEAWRQFSAGESVQGPGYAIGLNYPEICDSAWGDGAVEAHQAAAGTRSVLNGKAGSFSLEYPCRTATEQRWFQMTVTPLSGENRNGAVVMHLDITQRRRADEESRRFASAMDAASDAIYLVDRASMRFVHINDAACRMREQTREELLALGPAGVLSISRAELEQAYDAIIASGVDAKPIEMQRQRKDGSRIWLDLRRHALRTGDSWMVVTLVRDITERKQAVKELNRSESRFRSLSMLSSDWFWEQDENHRFVNFSGGDTVKGWGPDQSKAVGMRRWDLGGVEPITCSWDEHRRILDAHKSFRNFEYKRILGNGALQYVAASGEPVFDDDGRFSGYRGVATEITARKLADEKIKRLNRVYAVLSGINTLIVRVRDRGELFREACRIAVEAGAFKMAWIGVIDQTSLDGKVVARHGGEESYLDMVRLTAREGTPHSDWPGSRALRQLRPVICNDIATDPSVRPLRDELLRRGHKSTGCFPLTVAGRPEGVICLFSGEPHVFNDEETRLLAELAGDISLALEHIEKAEKLDRMTRVNAMLSGINGAIVRIRDRQELFEETCRIAVETGGMPFAWLCVADESGMRLRPAASAGADNGFLVSVAGRLSLRDDAPEGHGVAARSVRTKHTVVVNNVETSSHVKYKKMHADHGVKSIASLPLLISGKAVGAFILHAAETDFFDDDEMKLLQEVADNIAFALEHIEKEEKVRRLTRVYAVLSGINTLIVHARDRDELFKEACRIAVEDGKFAMAWIGVVDRNAMKIEPIASAGVEAEFLNLIKDRFSLRDDAPSANTMSARAIREKKAIVSNDIRKGPPFFFAKERIERGILSIAVLPLLVSGEAVGVLALYANEVGFFDEEEMKLLTELAGDVAFAIDHIGKQERLDYLAYYDELTGLANRSLLLERVAQYMRSAVSGGHKLALFFLDLERFRNINDSLGRPAGDALLKQVADLLVHGVGDPSLLARLGADQFAIVLPELAAAGNVVHLLEKKLRLFLDHAFRVNDSDIRIGVKVGAAVFPKDGVDAATLLRNAEVALKKAKRRGDPYLFYKSKMTDTVAGKLSLENQLREALDKEEFVLHYQPKVNLDSGKLTSAEALIRWNDPRTGLVPPGRFIPVLEETGLIQDVGRWALRKAIGDYLRWRTAGLPAVRIAVNVSPLQLRNRGFIDDITQVVSVDPHAAEGLELEITESLIMEDVEHNIASLKAIRAMGVTIAIDDFGTGFSSLSYLAKLPVDTLKIDRSFVNDMTLSPQGLSLVSTVITLAHSLKLKVVAEGVETEEQSRLLRLLRCDEMQGFLFSKPVPLEMFEAKFLAPAAGV